MMEKIFISVEKSSRMVSLTKKYIGNDLENLQQELVFKFTDEFVNGSARLEYQVGNNKYHIPMTKDGETYTVPIKNVLTKEGRIPMQLVIVQAAQDEEIPVFKSNVFDMWCNKSINAQEEAPDDYEYWLDIIEEKLVEMDNIDIDIQTVGDNTEVIITRKDGTKKEAIVSGGSGTITDVKVNNTSVVSGGVANIDLTSYVQDRNYIHTDNNYTTVEKNKLATLNNYDDTEIRGLIGEKQDELVSGTNIKTINNTSILGSGNIDIQGGGTDDYSQLSNKPQINSVTLSGNKSLSDLGIQPSGNYALKSEIPDVSDFITKNVNDLTYYYTKTEVDGKVSAVYKYKGTVATYSDLPSTGLTVGDVYNVETDGNNYAWTGTVWDALGGTVDLSGYQTKIDSTHKLSSDLVDDTNNTNKFVTPSEKLIWNGKQDTIIAGTNISIASDGKTISATDTTYNEATTSTAGLMSSSDKNKLNGIASGAEVNVQANWNESNSNSDAYIKNKPSIPPEVTETTVANWGFTKNTGDYSKPSGGIPITDLSNAVQTSLGLADTALQSHQDITGKEDKTNKVTSITSSSTNTQYPSALAVYNYIQSLDASEVSY